MSLRDFPFGGYRFSPLEPGPRPRRASFVRIAPVLSQVIVDPTVTPTLNDGGWVYNSAVLLAAIGVIITLLIVFGYMRFAPRFQTEEGPRTSVRAPRVQSGRDVRRPVNVTSAPLVVQPPMVASAVTVAAPAPVPTATPAAAPAPAAPAPAPATEDGAAAPGAGGSPTPTTPPSTDATVGDSPGADAAATTMAGAAAAPAATAERPEVSLDEETFEKTLAELLAKGTDRRVAEGQARRAAMIAARKKAGG
jgi:pyruvate dehydrogenase E2 component (dihydrolipoamide acetyltransferase)